MFRDFLLRFGVIAKMRKTSLIGGRLALYTYHFRRIVSMMIRKFYRLFSFGSPVYYKKSMVGAIVVRGPKRLLISIVSLVFFVFVSHSEFSKASDYYNYTDARNQSSSIGGTDYSTRWGRDTKPWSRNLSTTEPPVSNDWGREYSRSYDQEVAQFPSNRERWQSNYMPYVSDPWQQSDGWDKVPPRDEYHAQTKQKPDHWRKRKQQISSNKPHAPWKGTRDQHISDRRDDFRLDSNYGDSRRSPNILEPQGVYSRMPSRAYSNDPWSGWSKPSRSAKDGFGGNKFPPTQNPWAQDPWSNAPRDSKTHAPNKGFSRNQKYWKRQKGGSAKSKLWGDQQANLKKSRPKYQSDAAANRYIDAPPVSSINPQYSEHFGYGYPGYLKEGHTGYGLPYAGSPPHNFDYGYYGSRYDAGLGNWYPGFSNAPMLGDLHWF